jgi:hypothetical protein
MEFRLRIFNNLLAADAKAAKGGGINFHGCARELPNKGPRHLSWGCVVLHLSDISNFYDQLPAGAMVVIF